MKNHRPILRLFLCAALAGTSLAQTAVPASPPPLAPESHQFDFWLGDWDVGNNGAGSRIESIAEGRGILENWRDASGTTGKSLNVYNSVKKCWQQFWVGNGTPVLELSGGLVDGSMVLAGDRPLRAGGTIRDRITWTPNPDGTVRQQWEISKDGGQTWQTIFNSVYRRKKP